MKTIIVTIALLFVTTSVAAQEVSNPVQTPVTGADNLASPSPDELVKIRRRVEFLLSGYEFFPKRADFDAVAPGEVIAPILRDIVDDTTARPSFRTRAIDALGYFDDDDTASFLLERIAKKVTVEGKLKRVEKSLRHHAFLKNDDLQIRLTAITALGKFGGKAGKKVLIDAKSAEKNNVARSVFRKYVPD